MSRLRKIKKEWGTYTLKEIEETLKYKTCSGLDRGPINDFIRIIGETILESGDYMATLDQSSF